MHNLRLTLALLMGTFCATLTTAQNSLHKELVFKTYNAELKYNDNIYFDIHTVYPVSGPRPLVDSLCTAISNHLFEHRAFTEEGHSRISTIPAGTNLNPLLFQEAKEFVAYGMELEKEVSDPSLARWNYTQDISVLEESTHYVSLWIEGYFDGGGAHGMPWEAGMSFNNANGKIITWKTLFTPYGLRALNNIIYQHLESQYFEGEAPELWGGVSELLERAGLPVLSYKGVGVHYSPYSIGPYAMGRPQCIIPYSAVEKFMTPLGRQLINGR